MQEDYSIIIDLTLLPLPLRNKYMMVIKKLDIYYLLENQVLRISKKNEEKFFNEINKLKGLK